MNHQPFETWLLDEEPLSSEQTQALQEHLRDCEACQQLGTSWAGVRQALRSAPKPSPAAGFTARWQQRMAEERRLRHRRQTGVMLGLTAGAAILFFLFLIYLAIQALSSPEQLLLYGITRLFSVLSLANTVSSIVSVYLREAPEIPLPLAMLSVGLLSMLGVLWVITYKQLTTRRMQA